MRSLVLQMAGLGLASALHCMGMCGPFAIRAATGGRLPGFLLYGAGKALSYAFLGALAGALPGLLPAHLLRTAQGATALAAGVLLLLLGARAIRPARGASPAPSPLVRGYRALLRGASTLGPRARPFALGAATGFLPCGVVAVAIVLALGSRGPAEAVAALLALALATLPALLAAALFGPALARRLPRRIARASALVLILGAAGLCFLRAQAALAGAPPEGAPPCCH